MRFPRTHQTMEPCSLVSLPEVIKQLHQLQPVTKNSIWYILAQKILTTQLDVLMVMESYHVPFFPFQMVWFLECLIITIGFWDTFIPFFFFKLAKRREKWSHTNNFATNYFMHVLLISINPLNLQWHLRRLFGVLMVIITDQSSQLGLILQTIQNKYGLLQSSQTGVPCKKFIYLLSPADTWLCTRCDAKQGNLDDAHAHLWTYEKSNFLLEVFDPGIVWDQYGLWSDVVVSHIPFT